MSKVKMQAAKELIQAKKYDEARKILKTVDHPTAREWEEKLETLKPTKLSSRGRKIVWGFVIFLIALGVLFVAVFMNLGNKIGQQITATADLAVYCLYDSDFEATNCDEYASQTLKAFPEKIDVIRSCGEKFEPRTYTDQYEECLIDNSIPLP